MQNAFLHCVSVYVLLIDLTYSMRNYIDHTWKVFHLCVFFCVTLKSCHKKLKIHTGCNDRTFLHYESSCGNSDDFSELMYDHTHHI